jgi:hypothetical protein
VFAALDGEKHIEEWFHRAMEQGQEDIASELLAALELGDQEIVEGGYHDDWLFVIADDGREAGV